MMRGTLLCLAALALTSCAADAPRSYEFSGPTMGTTYTVKLVADGLPDTEREALDEGIVAELDLVNRLMSHYMETSELSRFNAHPETTPFPISPETAEVFRWALQIGERSGGNALEIIHPGKIPI